MPVKVNLRHLDDKNVHVAGEIFPDELEIDQIDELIQAAGPLTYDLTVERSNQSLLISGTVALDLTCECARCLKPFAFPIRFEPYNSIILLEGEEQVEVDNDMVDLTPSLREDTLLAFPQHPLCKLDCKGLVKEKTPSAISPAALEQDTSAAWAALNKLKL